MSGGAEIRVRVAEAEQVADGIKRLRLFPVDGGPLPVFSGGSHVVVSMQDGERRIRNSYSLMGSPRDTKGYEITVLRTPASRGGSIYIHEHAKVGLELTISYPLNLFPAARRARKHLLLAGGIGITPFIPIMAELDEAHATLELHYAMRSAKLGPYADSLANRYGRRVHLYRSDQGERIPVGDLLSNQPLGTHLYVCGPERMIEGVVLAAHTAGWPGENVHLERFVAPPGGEPFKAKLARSDIEVEVGPHTTLLEAVEAAGVDAAYLCRGGVCGQCETDVLACNGSLVHNDHFLTEAEHQAGRKLMICVSRFKGQELVLDL